MSDWDLAYGEAGGRSLGSGPEDRPGPRPRQKDPRGRKKGSVGSSILKGVLSTVESEGDGASSQPGTIEYARKCREEKLRQRKSEQLILVSDMDTHNPSSSSSSSKFASPEAIQYAESFGGKAATFLSVGDTLHRKLFDSMLEAHRYQLTEERDELVQHQLKDAMSHVSVKTLCKQIGSTGIGQKCLSIASCFLLLTGHYYFDFDKFLFVGLDSLFVSGLE